MHDPRGNVGSDKTRTRRTDSDVSQVNGEDSQNSEGSVARWHATDVWRERDLLSVEIDIAYAGKLQCRAVHGPSGHEIRTDAPVDNGGTGAEFSPTDLLSTALGTCIVTIMGLYAERHGLDITGTRVHVEKLMTAKPVRRIGRLRVVVTIPPEKAAALDEADRDKLERAATHCPVHASLHPDVTCDVRFQYGEP